MRKGKGIRLIANNVSYVISYAVSRDGCFGSLLDEVKDGDAIADWGQETSSIWGKEEVSFAVNSSQQIRELSFGLSCGI